MVEPGVPRVCAFFLRGRCQRAKCEFRHPADEEKSVTEESFVLNKTEEETILEPGNPKKIILNVEPAENVPKDFAAYLDDSTDATVTAENYLKSAPTSVIVAAKTSDSPKENGNNEHNGNNSEEAGDKIEEIVPPLNPSTESAEASAVPLVEKSPVVVADIVEVKPVEPTFTVADLVEEAEKKEEPEPPTDPPEKMEIEEDKIASVNFPTVDQSNSEEVSDKSSESETTNTIEKKVEEALSKSPSKKSVEKKVEEVLAKSPKKSTEKKVEEVLAKSPKKPLLESPLKAVKAAELVHEWDDDDMEDEEEIKPSETDISKRSTDSADENSASEDKSDIAPRKSSRAPKPTEKKLASKEQENLKADDEESIDAIAKELEKPDIEVKKTGKKDAKSPRKGKKGPGETKEDWVTLIFGENGEKVTEKGRKKGDDKEDDGKEDVPEAEEFLIDQTPFQSEKAKRGGRPRKKDLDEKLDGVSKLGSNMYFYTGPGGNKGGRESPSSMHSDEEEQGGNKSQSDSVRKSGRAGKGRNPRLDREDEFVDLPQTKAKEASLNPSWLKNHDGKTPSSAKKPQPIPITPVTSKSAPQPVAAKATPQPVASKATSQSAKKGKDPVMDAAAEEIATAMEQQMTDEEALTHTLKLAEMDKELPQFDPAKFTPGYTPKSVKKGEDEYVIVVSGVADTGLCGNYWGDLTNLPNRRRSKAPELLQSGKGDTPLKDDKSSPAIRRGSVGSTSSTDTPTTTKRTTALKKAATTPLVTPKRETTPKATPKSTKKQVTRPERKAAEKKPVVEAESSMDESEPEVVPEPKTKSRKRKAETEPETKKEKKAKAEPESETEEQKGFSDYDSAGTEPSPLRVNKKGSEESKDASNGGGDSGAAQVSSKQQTAVNAALAAGVPAGQQRSVSCVADTSTQREVVVECFAPYDDHRWVNIGKERDGMSPDAVQYARALRPPYHLLSFLRIKGHSTKGMSCTDKNTMVFVVLEGEITVILHTTQFNAKKGDSFYIPPKNYYNLINQKVREAELSLIQFQYDGPLPTVQPTQGNS